jgi:hypothetical protein
MVALKWDEMDQGDQRGQTEEGWPRLHLYVSPAERRPAGRRAEGPRSFGLRSSGLRSSGLRSSGLRPGVGAYHGARRRQVARWKFAVRRAVAVLVIAGFGALALSVAERLVASASTAGGSAASCTTLTLACPGAHAYIAVPGDTVWSIAVRFAHGGDPRPLVERLEAEIDGGVLQPGQWLAVP